MEKEQTPRYAPGQELTIHPSDPAPSPPEDPDEPETGDPGDLDGNLHMGSPRRSLPLLTLVAQYERESAARGCAEELRRLGVEAGIAVFPASGGEAGAQADEPAATDPGLSNGVAVGASLGATAGLLAATYVLPELAGPLINASSLVTTLAGAGLGSFLGGLTDGRTGEENQGEAGGRGAVVAVRVTARDSAAAEAVLRAWEPQALQVRPG